MLAFLKAVSLVSLLSYYMTEDFPDDVISNVSIYGNDTTL